MGTQNMERLQKLEEKSGPRSRQVRTSRACPSLAGAAESSLGVSWVLGGFWALGSFWGLFGGFLGGFGGLRVLWVTPKQKQPKIPSLEDPEERGGLRGAGPVEQRVCPESPIPLK